MKKTMKPEEDAYGQEVWAYCNGKETYEVVERDDGYIGAMNSKIYFSEYRDWSPFVQKAIESAKGRVLDVGCGAGRHSLYLQQKGLDVLGIDISPLAIKVCKLRGLKRAGVMSIDEVSFEPNSFDTIIMMGNNFGLFGNFGKARRLLRRFHKMTSLDATIVAATRDPYRTENPVHLEYHRLNKKRGRMCGQVRIRVRFQKYATKWFDYLMMSKEEMKEIIEGTGWKVKEFIDSGDSNYIAILEKEPPFSPS